MSVKLSLQLFILVLLHQSVIAIHNLIAVKYLCSRYMSMNTNEDRTKMICPWITGLQASIVGRDGCTTDRPGGHYYSLPQHKQAVMQSNITARQSPIVPTMHIMHPVILSIMQSIISAIQATMPSRHEQIIPIADYNYNVATPSQVNKKEAECVQRAPIRPLYEPHEVVDVTGPNSTVDDPYRTNPRAIYSN